MKSTRISSAGLPPSLPAVRPTSSGRIGPIFSHDTEYWFANTDLLFRLRFIHCPWWVLSSFLACLSLWLVNKMVRNCWKGVDELYSFYLLHHANGQMHVCLIASSVKIITKCIAVVYRFKSPGWFHVETSMHVLGLSYANTAGGIKQVRQLWYIGRSFHHVPIHIMDYNICNILCLNK